MFRVCRGRPLAQEAATGSEPEPVAYRRRPASSAKESVLLLPFVERSKSSSSGHSSGHSGGGSMSGYSISHWLHGFALAASIGTLLSGAAVARAQTLTETLATAYQTNPALA